MNKQNNESRQNESLEKATWNVYILILIFIIIKDHEFALSMKIMLHERFGFYKNWQMVKEHTKMKKRKERTMNDLHEQLNIYYLKKNATTSCINCPFNKSCIRTC